MRILLQRLIENAWIFYVVCFVGGVVYVARALAARRERSLALFTLERETATARMIQAATMVLVFIAIGTAVFVTTRFVAPNLTVGGESLLPTLTPTMGLALQPPGVNTPTPTFGPLPPSPTPTATTTLVGEPMASLPAEATELPTPPPTATPLPSVSGGMSVRFGDFAELIGFSLPTARVTSAEPLPLTLYWRGLEGRSPIDYLVFTHLLSEDGRMIAQHDGAPAGGSRQTTTWSAGEMIEDFHQMTFYDPSYSGPAIIAVGLYDPGSGRVMTQGGDDRVVLPITVMVSP